MQKPKPTISNFDKYIWSLVRRHYMITEQQLLNRYRSLNPGALKGALSRLKREQWLVMLPSMNDAYMTIKEYKERIADGMDCE